MAVHKQAIIKHWEIKRDFSSPAEEIKLQGQNYDKWLSFHIYTTHIAEIIADFRITSEIFKNCGEKAIHLGQSYS